MSEADDALLLFMEAIEEVCPKVIERLKADVWPAYVAQARVYADRAARHEPLPPAGFPEEAAYLEALAMWQERFNLHRWAATPRARKAADGLLPDHRAPAVRFRHLVETVLRFWKEFGGPKPRLRQAMDKKIRHRQRGTLDDRLRKLVRASLREAKWTDLLRWVLDKRTGVEAQLGVFDAASEKLQEALRPPVLPVYNPLASPQTWSAYRDSVADLLETYREKVEGAIREAGGRAATEKRDLAHFRWLVRYQVCGEAFTCIAEDVSSGDLAGTDENRVWKAVRRTADLFGLKLRGEHDCPHKDRT